MHPDHQDITVTTANGDWLCQGIQLEPRKFVPRWFGNFILWLLFHRTDSVTKLTLSRFVQ